MKHLLYLLKAACVCILLAGSARIQAADNSAKADAITAIDILLQPDATMLKHAAKAAGLGEFDGSLSGMTAVVLGNEKGDISGAAKILKQFGKDTQKPKVKLGVMGKQLLKADEVAAVADLPSLDALRAQIIGMLQTPATRIAVVLGAPASQLARVIKAHADKEGAVTPAAA